MKSMGKKGRHKGTTVHYKWLAACYGMWTPEFGKLLPVESEIWEKFCLWNPESWALKSKTQLKESGIPQTIGIQNQFSPDKDWDPIPVTRHPGAWNSESKTVLDSLIRGEVTNTMIEKIESLYATYSAYRRNSTAHCFAAVDGWSEGNKENHHGKCQLTRSHL